MTTPTAIRILGTLYEENPDDPPASGRYTYQRTAPGKGNLPGSGDFDLQRRRTVIPADPKTPAQLARRAEFAAAVTAWHALDPLEKEEWRVAAKDKGITGFNAFISQWMA